MIKEASKNNEDAALILALALSKVIETSSEKCNAKEQGESVRCLFYSLRDLFK